MENQMKIFDGHAHVFPEKIAEKASLSIGEFYKMPIRFIGSVSELRRVCSENNVKGALICSVATKPEQVKGINDFIAESAKLSEGFFTGFCSLHPDMSEVEIDDEINRAVSLGLKGAKLHPDFQEFKADSKIAYKIYQALENRLPLLIHAGDSRYDFSSPKRIINILSDFPKLTTIAAHFAGWSQWEDSNNVFASRSFDNLYVDTCSSFYALTPEKSREFIKIFGEDKILFGTDFPMWNVKDELKLFEKLELDASVTEKILYKNAQKLLSGNC